MSTRGAALWFGTMLSVCLRASAISTDTATANDDFAIDTALLKTKPYEIKGSIELRPALSLYNKSSPAYAVRFPAGGPRYSDAYNAQGDVTGQYRLGAFVARVDATARVSYVRSDDSLDYAARFYECYVKWSPAASFSLYAGKRAYLWGKGYLYTPVAFAARQKDINDIDAALEGYWGLSLEAVRGFQGPLANAALTVGLIPVYRSINRGYLRDSTLAGVAQAYALLFDTDIDVYLYGDSRKQIKCGLDFSRNVLPSWEIHGEWAWNRTYTTKVARDEATLVDLAATNVNDMVLGTRYLAPFNTTFILEYLHQGKGHSPEQMDAYYGVLAGAAANHPSARGIAPEAQSLYSGQYVMTDYVYVRATHPEPFTIVYFTPSVYALANLRDGSLMGGVELAYTRFNHVGFTARYVGFAGKSRSEYGAKLAQHRIEVRVKAVF
jgi:hypothetical protein